MKTRTLILTVAIAFAFLVAVVGCSTMVTIQSDPPGADIVLNNQKIGKTPFAVSLSDFAFNTYDVLLKKEGYEDYRGRISKEPKAGAIVGALIFGFPILWCYGPQPYQTFYLSETGASVGAAVVNRNSQIAVFIDGVEVSGTPMTFDAGIHQIAYLKRDGSTIRTQAELEEGNWYEFQL